jgi:hypothetical protein
MTKTAAIITAIAISLGIIMGFGISAQTQPEQPDITVMSCSAWDNGAAPTIPANTLTDTCVDERGALHTAPTAVAATR